MTIEEQEKIKSSLTPTAKWSGQYNKFSFEIVQWCFGNEHINNGVGIWNYYVILSERNEHVHPELFKQHWLKDRVSEYGRVLHDYDKTPIAQLYWHYGVTFYEKSGHTKGYRSVKFGCDFNHWWDESQLIDFESVFSECMITIKAIAEFCQGYESDKPQLTDDAT